MKVLEQAAESQEATLARSVWRSLDVDQPHVVELAERGP
jgi:hypothetical protein